MGDLHLGALLADDLARERGVTRAAARSPAGRAPLAVAALGAALFYWLTRQEWLFGDAPYLVAVMSRARAAGELPVWRHVLYLPLADLLLGLPGMRGPGEACRLVSALSGGVLAAASYALCRRSASRAASLAAALLAGTSAAVWFFATTVEIHALHGAVSALTALALVSSPRALRPAAIAAGPLLLLLAHESSWLLLPGWVLLAAAVCAPESGRPGRRELFASAGLTALGAALGLGVADLVKRAGSGAGELSALGLIEHLHRGGGTALRLAWSGALGPHLGTLVLALIGLARAPRVLLLAFLVPHILFVMLVFGDPNGGGYLLPIAWVLALGAARALDAVPWTWWLVAALLAMQLHGTRSLLFGEHQELARERRERVAEAARLALPAGGLVLSTDFSLQTIEGLAEGVHELNLWRELSAAAASGEPPPVFAERLVPRVADLRAKHPAVAIDLAYRRELAQVPEALALMEALTAAARARHGGAEVAELLVLGP